MYTDGRKLMMYSNNHVVHQTSSIIPMQYALFNRRYLVRMATLAYVLILTLMLVHMVLFVDFEQQVLSKLQQQGAEGRSVVEFNVRALSQSKHLMKDFTATLKPILQPSVVNCTDTDLVVFLKSRPGEFYLRSAIRETWGAQYRGRMAFVLGRDPKEASVYEERMAALKLESDHYQDLLLVDYVDSYANLSLKSLSILQWYTTNCKNVAHVLQGDSDTLMFPENIDDFLNRRAVTTLNKNGYIFGKCWTNAKVRRAGKWAVHVGVYLPNMYPRYCSGAILLMSGKVPQLLLASLDLNHPYFEIDDAFFTGILAETAGVMRINLKHGIYWDEDLTKERHGEIPCNCLRPLAILEFKTGGQMRQAHRLYTRFLETCHGESDE